MIELTVSQKKKVNLGNYESEDIMVAIKAQLLDSAGYEGIERELKRLHELANVSVSEEAEKLKGGEKDETA